MKQSFEKVEQQLRTDRNRPGTTKTTFPEPASTWGHFYSRLDDLLGHDNFRKHT